MLDQLKLINEARNSIVHFVALSGIPGDVRHLIDTRRALTEERQRRVSTTMLAYMTDDLRKI
jgi:hypothetical protein